MIIWHVSNGQKIELPEVSDIYNYVKMLYGKLFRVEKLQFIMSLANQIHLISSHRRTKIQHTTFLYVSVWSHPPQIIIFHT